MKVSKINRDTGAFLYSVELGEMSEDEARSIDRVGGFNNDLHPTIRAEAFQPVLDNRLQRRQRRAAIHHYGWGDAIGVDQEPDGRKQSDEL